MEIKKIKFKNICGYGDELTELSFDKNGEFYLINGKSGAGKSTIARAITFGIYGECDLKKTSLINRINKKNLWVEIVFNSNKHEVHIQRGIQPNKFKAYIDGKEITKEQAGKKNVQDYLEQEIFEIPYNIFKNIIVLSIVDFKSFLTMSPKDKREIIDRLFGFSVLNNMMEVLKGQKSELKKEISSIEGNIQSIEENRNNILSKLENIKESNDKNIKEKTENLKNELNEYNSHYDKLQKGLEMLKQKEKKLRNDYDELYNELNGKNEELNYSKKVDKLYENNQCPTCGSDLTTENHKKQAEENKEKIERLTNELNQEKHKIKEYKDSIDQARDRQNKAIEKISSIKTSIDRIKGELHKLENEEVEDDKTKEFESLLEDVNKSFDSKKELKKKKKNEEQFVYDIENIIGSGGVKKTAMEKLIPNLNKNIAKTIKGLKLPFQIHFDSEFNAIVKQFGEEIDVKTLSHGQEKRMNLAIILGLIVMIMFKYPNLNIMFIDELLGSLDDETANDVINILNDFIKDYGINAFIINHSPLSLEYFDWNINVYIDGGFSYLNKEKIK